MPLVVHEVELGYVVVEVPEPASLDACLGEVVGLVPAPGQGDDVRRWRNDGKAQRIVVRPGPAGDLVALGFEAVDELAFAAVAGRLAAVGCELVDGTPTDLEERRVQRLVRTSAPFGVDVELVLGLADADADADPDADAGFASPLVRGGFVTEGVGFGHAVVATTAFDDAHRFLVEGLGLRQSDWLETELAPGLDLEVRFYHGNERHHTVAVARAPFELPRKLHHLMVEVQERDDVGAAFDRAWASGLPIPNGLGRHDNDGMFSFYVETPAGFQVEVGHGARRITDDWADDRRYERASAWGHQPLR